MALATQCPHCSTTFRVASDQLKLRGGIVRCGACNEVFDGNASLIDLDTLAARQAQGPEAAPAEPVPAPAHEPESAPEPSASAAFDAEVAAIDAKLAAGADPIYTLDFDTTFDPFGVLPKSAQPAPEPEQEAESEPESDLEPEPEAEPASEPEPEDEHEPAPAAEPESELPADEEELAAAALPDADHEDAVADAADHLPAPLPLRESAPPEPLPADPVELTPTAMPVEPVPAAEHEPAGADEPEDADEPEFVKRGRRQERAGRTRRILMGAGSFILLLALAFQGVTTFRSGLAARFPQIKPALVSICAVLGCRVDLPAQIEALSVETGELQTLGGGTFAFTTLLRNQGSLVQAWPNIELALTDTNDKPLLRRVFTPAEYLPQGVVAANGFAPRAEQPVKLYFELKQLKASGYHIAVFYP